ncbi:pectin esterase [Kocuria sp. CNJ-770]|uniref:pectinesterase family protein n=1 Tax=Kocuria sp. CNJ-770 TaxID=1904964 RepID=UPI000960EDBB|nr:pectinesterase family protein [Kocuria sp. CNJ-770]OLT07181.1 pectin esterase [Kocuria sp. CNJ-770]
MSPAAPTRRTLLTAFALAAGSTALTGAAGTPALAAPGATGNNGGMRRTRPALFVVGDSTSSAYQHSERPRAGWGQALPLLLGPRAGVADYAWSGASSKSYADAGLLDRVLGMLQPGDHLLIAFGHNDEKVQDPAHGTLPGSTFEAYLRRYVDGAVAQGAQPVLVTPVERRRFDAFGAARDTHGAYPQAVRDLAAATGTPLVDLTASSKDLWQRLGPEGTTSHFLHLAPGEHPQYPQGSADNTHFQALGALAVARLVARELRSKRIVPPGWFADTGAAADPLGRMHWPAERPVDTPVVLDVGPGERFRTVQSAVDAAEPGGARRTVIRIHPGEYREVLHVPSSRPRISLVGTGEGPEDVVLVHDNASGTLKPDGSGPFGTFGSASARVDGADFVARNLTFGNDFDEAAHPGMKNRQAVALHLTGDRAVLSGVRLLGNQDTLLVNSPDSGVAARSWFDRCYVEGDVDFVFGRGTAVFDGCELRSLDRGSDSNNGYVTAGSQDLSVERGYLFSGCRFTSGAAAGTVHLGRPWHPGGDPRAVAQVLVRDSWLGAHIAASPWTDMSGFSWREARFAEHANRGPGARLTPDRPQLPAGEAERFTVRDYLAGEDGWAPQLAGTAVDSTALLDLPG